METVAAGRGVDAIDQAITAMSELEGEAERLVWLVQRATRYRSGRSTAKLSREEFGQLLRSLGGGRLATAFTLVDNCLLLGRTSVQMPVPPRSRSV